MQFGLFYEWPNPTLRQWKTLFEEGVEQIQYSEALGFDYCLIAEHHFSNYGHSPAPLMQALYIGQRTKRLKIGTAAVILPVWQPLRLAEEVAVLDNLIDGRFLCGVGRGYQPYEMAGFGRHLPESRQRFQETMEVLLKAWTQEESFTYDGKFVKVTNPVTVFPKPAQKPYPELLLMGTSVDSMRVAAQLGMLPFSSAMMGTEGIRAQFGALVHSYADLDKSLTNLRLGLQCMTHVAPTDEEACEALPYVRWQTRAQRGLNRQEVTNGRVNASAFQGELDDKSFLERLFFGSPETLIAKFKQAASVGVTHISNWMMFGGIEHEKLMRSIRLMGEEVIPALREVQPPADLADALLQEPVISNEELQARRFKRAPNDMAT
ncbi:MAG TPA: LLM class flavin-dependent oxidoreductase [Candidatus Tectomicrobia bacterium]|nr:LLM class flavin-dependent oxidoreductase [Candidatus Tectomicrobia bacterium]